ncbi:MAG: 50S ribosomal protein L18 [bacterium]
MGNTSRTAKRGKRRLRIRSRIQGTHERPRLCVMVSNKRIYAQFIDDMKGFTLGCVSTADEGFKAGNTVPDASALGKRAASVASEKGIKKVVFDRGGFKYHGRVKAFADAVREGGLCF